jgi:hypothetical protein
VETVDGSYMSFDRVSGLAELSEKGKNVEVLLWACKEDGPLIRDSSIKIQAPLRLRPNLEFSEPIPFSIFRNRIKTVDFLSTPYNMKNSLLNERKRENRKTMLDGLMSDLSLFADDSTAPTSPAADISSPTDKALGISGNDLQFDATRVIERPTRRRKDKTKDRYRQTYGIYLT